MIYMSNYKHKQSESGPIVPLSVIMNQFALQSAGSQDSTHMEDFLSSIPERTLHTLANAPDKGTALQLACDYVVRYYQYIPMDACMMHGDFVYQLLERASRYRN